MKTIWTFAALTVTSLAASAQAQDPIDIAKILIGAGHQSATYTCADGATMQAVYDIRPDMGPTVIISHNGKEAYKLHRYMKPSEYEINQAVLAVSFDSSSAIEVFYRTPTEIETIRLGYRTGQRTEMTHRCSVRSVTYAK